jgi:hypothetical protein
MTDSFDQLCALLGEKLDAEIIETSEESTQEDYSLPAVIVDAERGNISPLTEDPSLPFEKASFSLTVCVAKTYGNKEARRVMRQAAKSLAKDVIKALIEEYSFLDYDDVYYSTVPFGAAECYACSFRITLPEQSINLS